MDVVSTHISEKCLDVTDPIARLHIAFIDSFHNTALLVRNIAHPVCLPRRNNQMCTPPLYMSVELFRLIDGEVPRIFHRTARAVMEALVAIDGRVGRRKESIGRGSLFELATVLSDGWNRKCGAGGRESVVDAFECRGHSESTATLRVRHSEGPRRLGFLSS